VAPLMVLAAGCGSTTRVGAGRIFQIALTEYHVAPQSVSVPSGTVSIFVHNYGRLSHNLVISTGGRPLAARWPRPSRYLPVRRLSSWPRFRPANT
jgi:hypothetical protein